MESTCQNRPPFVSFWKKAAKEWKSPGANDPQRTCAPSVRGKMPEELVFIIWILDRCLLENPFLWPLDADCCDRSCTNKTALPGCCWHANDVAFHFTARPKDGTRRVVSLPCATSGQAALLPPLSTSHFHALHSTKSRICYKNMVSFFSLSQKHPKYVVWPTTTSFCDKVTTEKGMKTTTLWVQMWVFVKGCKKKKICLLSGKTDSVVCYSIWKRWWWVSLNWTLGNRVSIGGQENKTALNGLLLAKLFTGCLVTLH